MASARNKTSLLTRVEMLSALEVHIPYMRALYHKLAPLTVAVSEWDRETIAAFDKELRASKKSRLVVDEALREFTNATLRNHQLEDLTFDVTDVNLPLCFTLVKEYSLMAGLAQEVTQSYSMPYQVLCSRITNRASTSGDSEDLHMHYGVFNQAKARFNNELAKVQEYSTRVMDYIPHTVDLVDGLIELGMRSTDLLQSLQKLNGAHHRGIEYAYRAPAAHG